MPQEFLESQHQISINPCLFFNDLPLLNGNFQQVFLKKQAGVYIIKPETIASIFERFFFFKKIPNFLTKLIEKRDLGKFVDGEKRNLYKCQKSLKKGNLYNCQKLSKGE